MREYFDDPVEQRDIFGIQQKYDSVPIEPVKNEWTVLDNPRRYARKFTFGSTWRRNAFVHEALEIEKNTGHDIELWLSKGAVEIQTYTHVVNDITEIDLEIANALDGAYRDVKHYELDRGR
jgi:pterin-4a-carbinolamine dehydratase